MEKFRSAVLDCSLWSFGPNELVASGPRHGIKTSLWEVINSGPVPPEDQLAGLLQDTTLSPGAVSHGAPGPGPDIFHIHSQVCVSVNGPGCLCAACDPINDLRNIIKNFPGVKL